MTTDLPVILGGVEDWLSAQCFENEGLDRLATTCRSLITEIGAGRQVRESIDESHFDTFDRSELIKMERDQLLGIVRMVGSDLVVEEEDQAFLAFLAESYARCDDVQVTASLLRAAGALGAKPSDMRFALEYVLAQQGWDGSFGMVAPELKLLQRQGSSQEAKLVLTQEVLLALASYDWSV